MRIFPSLAALSLVLMAGCAPQQSPLVQEPTYQVRTTAGDELNALPSAERAVTVAVYDFRDLTGQNKPNDEFAEYSRAVTQGGAALLINALQEVGRGSWFQVVERESLNDLLQERQIIRATREEFIGRNQGQQPGALPPLLFAGIILDGGIVGYDSNTLTGGFGARFLGIGGDVKYRQDTVTVALRAVSVSTGEVIRSVTASKTIYSAGVSAGVFKFVSLQELLEIETGLTTNEPPMLAVRQAIEKAVFALIMEGTLTNYWGFADPVAAQPIVDRYVRERHGEYNVQTIVASQQQQPSRRPRRQIEAAD